MIARKRVVSVGSASHRLVAAYSRPWESDPYMAKIDVPPTTPTEGVISIIGVGMTVEGDSETDGSLRIEGTIRGDVRAGKSVVIGKGGLLEGNLYTQDAVIAGRVLGAVYAESHLELQATSDISGENPGPADACRGRGRAPRPGSRR